MKQIFYDRELSWLAFNERVLQEARDENVPIMQRLRFLGIYDNNQDEFIKIRLAELMQSVKNSNADSKKYAKTMDVINLANEKINNLQETFIQTLTEIKTKLEEHAVFLKNESQLSENQKNFCREYFSEKLSPQLTTIILNENKKFPFLKDNNVFLAVAFGSAEKKNYSIIQIPVNENVPRFVVLPSPKNTKELIFVEDIVRLCMDKIFSMFPYDEISAYAFKIYREELTEIDDDGSKNFIQKVAKNIRKRIYGGVIKLVCDSEISDDLCNVLCRKFHIESVNKMDTRYLHLNDLMSIPKVDKKLEYAEQAPLYNTDIEQYKNIFDAIQAKDILLDYPYHRFEHLVDFLGEAAIDPDVKSIHIAIYRTAENSKVLNALCNAAKNGKKVTVMMELLASFDEERNIKNAQLLKKEGINVVFGPKNLKVHAKILLIERKENKETKAYAYIATGNFNEKTARVYSDFALLTANPDICADLRNVFHFVETGKKKLSCKELLTSPFEMRKKLVELIDNEIENLKIGLPAFIDLKLNGLTDKEMIEKLYEASQAGVKIRMIVRSECRLVPQQEGLSEHIEVRSIVDKYLEHGRLFIFHNNGDEKMYISSGDFMARNLDRRIEVATPILDENIKQTLRKVFDIQWNDNVKAREIPANNYVVSDGEEKHRAQEELYDFFEKKNN
ncbi:polyphosphate kinase [Bacteroidia bacterium]|nr:polyphosphate kinase [Bacteroidia bacterium]